MHRATTCKTPSVGVWRVSAAATGRPAREGGLDVRLSIVPAHLIDWLQGHGSDRRTEQARAWLPRHEFRLEVLKAVRARDGRPSI